MAACDNTVSFKDLQTYVQYVLLEGSTTSNNYFKLPELQSTSSDSSCAHDEDSVALNATWHPMTIQKVGSEWHVVPDDVSEDYLHRFQVLVTDGNGVKSLPKADKYYWLFSGCPAKLDYSIDGTFGAPDPLHEE